LKIVVNDPISKKRKPNACILFFVVELNIAIKYSLLF
jgi:hypothetical protein